MPIPVTSTDDHRHFQCRAQLRLEDQRDERARGSPRQGGFGEQSEGKAERRRNDRLAS